MIYTISNGVISVRVDDIGAELKGIYSYTNDLEYMWQPGYEIWDHSSMLLFPNPARISRDRTVIRGKVYPATMHGFAYNSRFSVVSQSENHLELELCANEDTLRSFPYDFRLRVRFELCGNVVKQIFRIWNEDGNTMHFSFGAHPGFYLPLVLGESGSDYVIQFDRPQTAKRLHLQPGTSLLIGTSDVFLNEETDISLSEDYFNDGSKVLTGIHADYVTLSSKKSGRFVKLGIQGFPYMCLWGNPCKNALICMEPWCGVSDLADTDHIWENKLGIEYVEPGEAFVRTLTFEVG